MEERWGGQGRRGREPLFGGRRRTPEGGDDGREEAGGVAVGSAALVALKSPRDGDDRERPFPPPDGQTSAWLKVTCS